MPRLKGTQKAGKRIKDVTDLREKATLLLSDDTPFFELVKHHSDLAYIDKHTCEDLYGVSLAALNTWKNGIPKIGINTTSLETLALKINDIYCTAETPASDRYPVDLNFMINSDKYEFGELLGVQWQDVRSILDKRLYVRSLATTLLTMPTRHTRILGDIKGICIAWHMTPTLVNDKIEYRLVRSLLDICDPIDYKEEKSVYRCRWRLPYIKKNRHNKDLTHYHYLGSVAYTRESDTFTWLFEPKNPEAVEGNPDYPYFLTQGSTDNDTLHFGFYVSKCQDNLIYTSSIALCKVNAECEAKIDNTPNGLLEYRRFMNQIIGGGVFEDIQEAKGCACCKNEARLLEIFEPACDVLGHAMVNARIQKNT